MVESAPSWPAPGAGPGWAGGWGPRAGRPHRHRLAGFHRRLAHGLGRRGTGPQPPTQPGPAPGAREVEAVSIIGV